MTGFLDRRQGEEGEPARDRPPIAETETLARVVELLKNFKGYSKMGLHW